MRRRTISKEFRLLALSHSQGVCFFVVAVSVGSQAGMCVMSMTILSDVYDLGFIFELRGGIFQ